MLIGFLGAGGTGKTTTAKFVAQRTGLPFRASSSRAVFEKHRITERDQLRFTPEQQYELQLEIFEARVAFEATFHEGVCDRTLLDQLAYNLLRAHGVIIPERQDALYQTAMASLRRYDLLFYFPLTTFPKQEGDMRDDIWGSRYVFDAILTRLIQDTGITVERLPVLPVESRAAIIISYLSGGKQ